MNYRYMRVMVFFDLPVLTAANRNSANRFRKFLIKDGFFMMQESAYCKLAQNQGATNAIIDHVKKNSPPEGLVQLLIVTEKQYSSIVLVIGKGTNDVVTTSDRLIIV
jgi:CRISPR-associated protein Cas2